LAAPLRILQIYPKNDYFTGAAIQLWELAQGLRGHGHEVLIATRASDDWAERCHRAGISHYALPMRSEIDVASVIGVMRILREHRIDVVHAHKGKGRTCALLAGLFVPFHALVLNRGVSFPLGALQRLGYTTRRVHAIVAVCEAIKRGLIAARVPAEKIEVIYSGTDTTRFRLGLDGNAVRRALGFSDHEFVFTQIGVRSWKGNGDAIDAMVWLAGKAPHARLLIVGARNPETLVDHARRRRVLSAVRVIGYRTDIPEILTGSDCCLDASYAGAGITGTLREALAVGTPVIATDIEGNPELVLDGHTGLLVPARRPDALARAMLQIIEDPQAARAMAMNGYQRVTTEFSIVRKVDRTESLYRRLVGGGWPSRL
jgi:glycosyltransferase involved in cell wall biosynthesis